MTHECEARLMIAGAYVGEPAPCRLVFVPKPNEPGRLIYLDRRLAFKTGTFAGIARIVFECPTTGDRLASWFAGHVQANDSVHLYPTKPFPEP